MSQFSLQIKFLGQDLAILQSAIAAAQTYNPYRDPKTGQFASPGGGSVNVAPKVAKRIESLEKELDENPDKVNEILTQVADEIEAEVDRIAQDVPVESDPGRVKKILNSPMAKKMESIAADASAAVASGMQKGAIATGEKAQDTAQWVSQLKEVDKVEYASKSLALTVDGIKKEASRGLTKASDQSKADWEEFKDGAFMTAVRQEQSKASVAIDKALKAGSGNLQKTLDNLGNSFNDSVNEASKKFIDNYGQFQKEHADTASKIAMVMAPLMGLALDAEYQTELNKSRRNIQEFHSNISDKVSAGADSIANAVGKISPGLALEIKKKKAEVVGKIEERSDRRESDPKNRLLVKDRLKKERNLKQLQQRLDSLKKAMGDRKPDAAAQERVAKVEEKIKRYGGE